MTIKYIVIFYFYSPKIPQKLWPPVVSAHRGCDSVMLSLDCLLLLSMPGEEHPCVFTLEEAVKLSEKSR